MARTAEAREADLIRTYVDAHEYAAITVVERGGGAAIEVVTSLCWGIEHVGVWWLADHEKAKSLVASVPRGLMIEDAVRLVQVHAERSRLRLTDHATMIERGRGAVALIEKRLLAMKANGDMRALNTEYQDHRLFNKEKGRSVKPYWSWLHDRKVEMVKAVALTAIGKRPYAPPRQEKLTDLPPIPRRRKGRMRMIKTDRVTSRPD